MFFQSQRTSWRFGRIIVPMVACLALPLLVMCGRDNPTQSRSAVPVRVVVTPEKSDLASAGQSVRLSAQALDDAGQVVPESPVTWRSSDTDVVTVSSDGLVTAVGEGSAVITAMAGQKTGNAQVTVSDPVRRALVALYRATGGENWKNSNNWLSDEPVNSWHGVTTATSEGSATGAMGGASEATGASGQSARAAATGSALSLPDNGLSGPIPPELGNLVFLRMLDLSGNGLTGSIPPELGNLVRLEVLNLSGNRLSGPVPAELGDLFVLKSMQLQENAELSGPLPIALTGLTGLETLDLSGTGLCAPSDVGIQRWLAGVTTRRGVAACGAVADQDRKALIALYEATDGPNWTNKTNWQSGASLNRWHGVSTNAAGRVVGLRLSGNRLTGTIPTALGNLTALTTLDLGSNELSGTIPVSLGSLSGLTFLDLSDNRLSGTIPIVLFTLANLQTLDLSGNLFDLDESSDRDALVALYNATDGPNWWDNTNWLSDRPLEEWYGVSTNAEGRVDSLRLQANQLSGILPPELGDLSNLRFLDIQRNPLSGSIPPELGNLTNLHHLELDRVPFTESIPPELGNLSNLRYLGLTRNQLSGPVPQQLGALTNLEVLWLSHNVNLSGPLPGSLANLSNLRTLSLLNTGLCAPTDAAFQAWLKGIGSKNGIVNCDPVSPVPGVDRASLVALYNATDGQNWTNNTHWLSDEPLEEWYGVSTNAAGRVDSLLLRENLLSGNIPPDLANLSKLTWLDLGENSLSGSIPPELGNLSNLQTLDLAYGDNALSGDIPPELGDLADLTWLRLAGNKLTGTIPPELGKLDNLERLDLDNNELSGGVPSWLGNLTNLNALDLSSNQLSGTIPTELGNLTNLRLWLLLQNNQLSGSIPSSLGNLTNLKFLYLSGNQLTGSIPPELGSMTNLESLNLWNNELSGTIPVVLSNLSNLSRLLLGTNQLSGNIPSELGNLSNLTHLNLDRNQLSGRIPPELGRLSNLQQLLLNSNALTGALPSSMVNLTNLRVLYLNNTQLCVPTDAAFQAWLAGVPEKGGVVNCTPVATDDRDALVALYNATDGPNWSDNSNWLSDRPIGEWFGVTSNTASQVTELKLWNNGLTGSIPAELGNLSNLSLLDLGSNGLGGTIPAELSNLTNLRTLHLVGNELSGSIPAWLGNFNNLQNLDFGHNPLGGTIPAELSKLTNLRTLQLYNSGLSGTIPTWLGNLNNLQNLGLDHNSLGGTIPAELSNLTNLRTLQLAGNQLSGSIPSELGRLSNLIWLTLDSNQLSGSVPSELGDLNNLTILRLANNPSLSGPLPDALVELNDLNILSLEGTDLCTPTDTAFQTWLTGIRTKSGVVNCADAGQADVGRYLEENPRIADAMLWRGTDNQLKPYEEWPQALKGRLVLAAVQLKNNGTTGLPEVMVNQAASNLNDDDFATTVLSTKDAEDLYLANVAYSLVLEMNNTLPWSLDDLSDDELLLLFSSRYFYRSYREVFAGVVGYEIGGRVLPAPPDVIRDFLASEGLVGSSRYDTIIRTIDWARYNLYHYSGGQSTGNVEDHWGYRGVSPLARMLSGAPKLHDGRNPTAGCHGTNWFFVHLLRAVNIPAEYVTWTGHAIPSFPSESIYLSHGDDPYSGLGRYYPPFPEPYPSSELPISEATYTEWFSTSNPHEENLKNVGRKTTELGVEYLSPALLNTRCSDLAAGRSNADSYVYAPGWFGIGNHWTVDELEAMGFWERMDAKIEQYGGCSIFYN